ncbi:MAG: hypothetical protein K9L30_15845 [Desulfobacterales bacterium]|nr:hypothetical protein [Desulfobacterales bacterium]
MSEYNYKRRIFALIVGIILFFIWWLIFIVEDFNLTADVNLHQGKITSDFNIDYNYKK